MYHKGNQAHGHLRFIELTTLARLKYELFRRDLILEVDYNFC